MKPDAAVRTLFALRIGKVDWRLLCHTPDLENWSITFYTITRNGHEVFRDSLNNCYPLHVEARWHALTGLEFMGYVDGNPRYRSHLPVEVLPVGMSIPFYSPESFID